MLEAILNALLMLTVFLPASSEPVKTPRAQPPATVVIGFVGLEPEIVDQVEEDQWRR